MSGQLDNIEQVQNYNIFLDISRQRNETATMMVVELFMVRRMPQNTVKIGPKKATHCHQTRSSSGRQS